MSWDFAWPGFPEEPGSGHGKPQLADASADESVPATAQQRQHSEAAKKRCRGLGDSNRIDERRAELGILCGRHREIVSQSGSSIIRIQIRNLQPYPDIVDIGPDGALGEGDNRSSGSSG